MTFDKAPKEVRVQVTFDSESFHSIEQQLAGASHFEQLHATRGSRTLRRARVSGCGSTRWLFLSAALEGRPKDLTKVFDNWRATRQNIVPDEMEGLFLERPQAGR